MGYFGSNFNGKPGVKRTFLASVLIPKLAFQSCLKIAHLNLPPSRVFDVPVQEGVKSEI